MNYAMNSLLDSVEAVSDSFLQKGKEITQQVTDTLEILGGCFMHFLRQARDGAVDLAEGLTGIALIPIAFLLIIAVIPAIALTWTILFFLAAIAHTLSVPFAYIWYLYQKAKELLSSTPDASTSIDYFPEVAVEVKTPVIAQIPPVLIMSGLVAIAGIGIELEPVVQTWSPSYLPITQEESPASQVETLDIEAFRTGLEQQFNAFKPRYTWKEYILQNLRTTESLEEPLILAYPQCEINPNSQLEIVQEITARQTVSPFPTPTTSCVSEVEYSLPVEVPTVLEFPTKPSNQVLQRWDKTQLIAFCDRINAIQKGSITKYRSKGVSKTNLIKKIKLFYEA